LDRVNGARVADTDRIAFRRRACGAAQDLKMPNPKDDPKSPEWRPYIFARDQWHCRICGDRFQYSEAVRKHVAHAHHENMPPSMYEYFRGAVADLSALNSTTMRSDRGFASLWPAPVIRSPQAGF
jgi:hypothetical protein